MNSNSVESLTALAYDTMRIDDSSAMDLEVNEIDWKLMTMIDFESSEPDWLSTMMDFELYIPDWQLPTSIMEFELEQMAVQFTINSLIDNALASSIESSRDDFAAGTTEEPLVNSHHEETGVASSTKSSTDVEHVDSDLEMPDEWKSTKDDAVAGKAEEELVNSHQDAVELSYDLIHIDAMLKMHYLLSSVCLFYTFTNALLSFFVDENQSQVCKETELNSVSSFGVETVGRIDEITPQEPIVETITNPDEILPQVIKTRYGRVVRKPVVYTDLTFSRRQQRCAAMLQPITTTRSGRIIRKPTYYSEYGFF